MYSLSISLNGCFCFCLCVCLSPLPGVRIVDSADSGAIGQSALCRTKKVSKYGKIPPNIYNLDNFEQCFVPVSDY